MAKIEQFKCDGCGKLRTDDANNWWTITIDHDGEGIMVVSHFGVEDGERVGESWRDFCGQQCALAFISAQMAGGQPKV